MERITLFAPDDFHVHLREGDMLRHVVPFTARVFARGLLMPNLKEPVCTGNQAISYRTSVIKALELQSCLGFAPLMTIQITEDTTPEIIYAAKDLGVIAGKIYPRNMTHNSAYGVSNYKKLFPVFGAMQECGMVACFHGESPSVDVYCLDREEVFLDILDVIVGLYPGLKMVFEHITTEVAVDWVMAQKHNVAATITLHHLMLTLDDIIGGNLNPYAFCKPVAKHPQDRDTLLAAAFSGDPRFFFGSDSAPHLPQAKMHEGCAGIFSAPVALPALASVFEKHRRLEKLQSFVSGFGAAFYGLAPNTDRIELYKEPWIVPSIVGECVPFLAGQTLEWRVARV